MAEGLIRRLPPFSRFLKSISLANGEMINFTKLANDCQVPPSTVTEYVGVLEDKLVGFLLPAWTESKKRKAIKTKKFYFFDPGVTHFLAGTESLDRSSNLYGKSFEQFIGMELRAYLSYTRKKLPLTYWRSKNEHEVDFLGNGTWKPYLNINVPSTGYRYHVFEDGFSAHWVRVTVDRDCTATAYFMYN